MHGIYRLSGASSNVQRLRSIYEEGMVPQLVEDPLVMQDIHAVSSLLKMYFRELPQPLCTFHLYQEFVEAAQARHPEHLLRLRAVVLQLPRPHYQTLEYLARHLHRMSQRHEDTGMTIKVFHVDSAIRFY